MSEVVASYQTSAFATPTNATPANADEVRGNDNTIRASHNSHDSDSGIHFQSSTLAARPAAGTIGRKWLTSDDRKVFYDNGSVWQEIAYAPTSSPTFTGTVTAAAVTLSGVLTLNHQLVTSNGVISSTAATTVFQASGASGLSIHASHAAGDIRFSTNSTQRWSIQTAGHLIPAADVTLTVGNAALSMLGVYSFAYYDHTGAQLLGAAATGWTTDPTGTFTRTTFVSDSVTLPNLAARVAALITDLRTHGMIKA